MAHALHSGAIGSHDPLNRHRDALPSISHLDLDKLKTGRGDASKYSSMHGLNISTAPLGSPNTIYSGPPPPYSSASSTIGSTHGLSGYISTPDSATRRLLREEKESPYDGKSLPSIHEALGNKSIPYPAPPSAIAQNPPTSTPSTTIPQSFPDVARGPGNPFSHPSSTLRDKSYTTLPQTNAPPTSDPHQHKGSFSASEPRSSISQPFGYPNSPPSNNHIDFRGSTSSHTSLHNHNEAPLLRSPRFAEPSRPAPSFAQYNNQPPSSLNPSSQSFQFTALPKIEDQRPPFPRTQDQPYGDTVKRHLDVYDAEVSLNEIAEITSRTAEFARTWLERRHSDNRTSLSADHLPNIQEVDDMIRHSHRMVENFNRIRDVIIAQETAMSEHRARMARGNIEDEYGGASDEYKGGGFAGGDAKKRRGKAAPPGRCHSCNRAETPEWRRGPDGARTLCNACGLHYAKLTRKMGVNKAATLTGSNLRPKTMDPRN